MVVKVAINGYGTIGKRVADAVTKQDDMEIVGVTKTRPTIEAWLAIDKGFPLYTVGLEHEQRMMDAGIPITRGALPELLKKADIVIDCAPGKMGASNKETYTKFGIKAVWQGGEKDALVETSFNALSNYNDAWGKQFVRVVSCNTTGLARTLFPVREKYGIKAAYVTMVRRAADPGDSKKGPVNAIKPVLKVPSHHGPDAKTVMDGLNIFSLAVAVPSTLMHLHCNTVELEDTSATTEDVLALWEATPRIKFVDGAQGIASTAEIMELARDLHRERSDFNEIILWKDGVKVLDGVLYYYQAIHQESDVIPENVDVIRSMCEVEPDNMKSILKTNKALGIE
jgi:glyceraldehyde-3-phosphate dehydrogenase (NAD(P))